MVEEFIELSQSLLEKRNYPLKPEPYEIEGLRVKIKPVDLEQDYLILYNISNGSPLVFDDQELSAYDSEDFIWIHKAYGPFYSAQEFRDYFSYLDKPDSQLYTVFDSKSNSQIGVISLINCSDHLKVEISEIFFTPHFQKNEYLFEAFFLLISKIFDKGYRRVEARLNKADLKMKEKLLEFGFDYEGIKRFQCIYKGASVDIAWFCILDEDWEEIERRLKIILYNQPD